MKTILITMILLLLISCTPIPMVKEEETLLSQNKVWCCCQTAFGGQVCCGWATICPGPIQGCFCK